MLQASVFELRPTVGDSFDQELVIAAHHPGEAEFFWPTLPYLAAVPGLRTVIMAAGCADESLRTFPGIGLEPLCGTNFKEMAAICDPALILTGAALKPGIHLEPGAVFPNAPYVLAEEYYGSAALHLERCLEEGWPLPDRICTFDQFAKQELVSAHDGILPGFASRIEVTGQPAFDYLFDGKAIKEQRESVRRDLRLTEADTLVSCFATVGAVGLVGEFAQEMGKSGERFSVAFNKHPRDDATDMDAYSRIFEKAGVPLCNTEGMTSRQLIAAADIVAILPHSTLALHAIQHDVPTLHVGSDPDGPGASQVPVRRGVSPYVSPSEFLSAAEGLLDPSSSARHRLLENMEATYPAKGGSAARVAAYITGLVEEYAGLRRAG